MQEDPSLAEAEIKSRSDGISRQARRAAIRAAAKQDRKTKRQAPVQIDAKQALLKIRSRPELALLADALQALISRVRCIEVSTRVLGRALHKKKVLSDQELEAFEKLLINGPEPLEEPEAAEAAGDTDGEADRS
jgi:hypothetical protein